MGSNISALVRPTIVGFEVFVLEEPCSLMPSAICSRKLRISMFETPSVESNVLSN